MFGDAKHVIDFGKSEFGMDTVRWVALMAIHGAVHFPANLAPFSYLTLFCPIVNEISGPKRVTHHIFYSVQKIADVQRKKES